jgi:DNA-directed RNA polymerase subunit RPC12/RpoP
MFNTTYQCSRCGKTVSKSDRVCPHCRALLAGIRCTRCGFVGVEKDFANDLCPKCGSYVRTSSTQGEPVEKSTIFIMILGFFATIFTFVALKDAMTENKVFASVGCCPVVFGVVAIICWIYVIYTFAERKKSKK